MNDLIGKARGRDNNFNLLRVTAAGAVLVSHAFPISVGYGAAEPLSASLSMTLGGLGVISFFVISGFFISQSFENNSLLRFFMARLLRIYPALLVVLLFSALVIGPLFTQLSIRDYLTNAYTISYLPRNLSLKWLQYELPGVFATNPYPAAINGSLWSLFYEVACYGIVVAIGALGIFRQRWWFCAFLSIYASIYFALKLFSPVHNYLLEHTAFMALHGLTWPFVLGMAAYHFRQFLMTPLHLLMCAGAGCIALLSYRSFLFHEAFVFFWSLLIFYVGYLSFKPLKMYNRCGDYSYGVYIYAFPCEQIGAALWPGISPVALMAVSLPATLVLAMLSWHLVERRALAFRTNAAAWLEYSLSAAARAGLNAGKREPT